ncbi:methyltransferase domain-containing protein [Jiangella aurantiaca]|uniref:Methyltransferase domain-containing protein n=1 Tax=Jiangella aurantiaca TaxID=2530373 RepID=A0A4R5ABH4_9ACTN|nr:rRNA adenine dimethyltransferase family protein [Jiangella aurantiaca]TDD68339.1 methyltransferase domain-containing protein [Jiangella aurantiaca]
MPRHARTHSRTHSRTNRPASNSAPNHAGIHLLRDPSVSARMVRSSGAGPGDLVVELGAGLGALTAPLAETGARVIAVERDPRFVAKLRRRFDGDDGVRVVEADARTVMLPHRPYAVVANIPYAISTALLRRLLDPEATSVQQADLLVEWGFAKRMTDSRPRDLEVAWWQARFELSIAGRVRPGSFRPAPSVDSAHLVVRRRTDVSRPQARLARRLLQDAYRQPHRAARDVLAAHVPKKRAHRLLTSTGIDPPAAAETVPTSTWLALARDLTADAADAGRSGRAGGPPRPTPSSRARTPAAGR